MQDKFQISRINNHNLAKTALNYSLFVEKILLIKIIVEYCSSYIWFVSSCNVKKWNINK